MSDELIDSSRQKMFSAVSVFKNDLATLRTGRATPALVENVEVLAYGTKMPLIQLGTIHAPDSGTILITPFDVNNIDAIVKSLQEANLGLTPLADNNVIRINIPAMTLERRNEFIKLLKTKVEGAKVMVRQVRRETMEDIAKQAENEDEVKRLEKILQELTDEMVAEIEVLGENKEKELLTV
ncbi:MAG: ribosome recycling factor [Patescibacteria group bacterium]|nr:ribosome recycling factor [Patescibacteria group bacterium]